jgi:hypothetical protein
MDSLNNIDNIDSLMGYDDSYEFQDLEKFSIPTMNYIHNIEGINEYENYEIVEDIKENFSNNNNDLKKITLLNCPNEDIIWSTKTLGAQSSGNELFFDRDETLKLDGSKNIFLYTKDLKKKSKINKIVHMNSPNNECPSTRITTDEDQDFSGEMGEVFFVGLLKEEADNLINKTIDNRLYQNENLSCPSCPKLSPCTNSSCPPVPVPKPDIQCNSIYYFIIGVILSLIIFGLFYYFVLFKKEEE